MNRSNVLLSLLVGALSVLILTIPLLALLFLANLVVSVLFIPYDVFDLVSRSLPGSVVTFDIDSIVGLLRALDMLVRDTAKLAEQSLVIVMTLALIVVDGAVSFGWQRSQHSRWRTGLIYSLRPFESGEHNFTVRCFEGDGTPQITERRPPHPSGATGLNSKQAMV